MSDAASPCRCDHARTSPDVAAEPAYGPLAWIVLLMGATGTPRAIRYRCRCCGRVVGETRDPAVLRAFR